MSGRQNNRKLVEASTTEIVNIEAYREADFLRRMFFRLYPGQRCHFTELYKAAKERLEKQPALADKLPNEKEAQKHRKIHTTAGGSRGR